LSEAHSNILAGEGVIKFLCSEATILNRNKPSSKTKIFCDTLNARMEERRDPVLISLIMYLANRDSLKVEHPLGLSTKKDVIKFGIDMMDRLFKDDTQEISNVTEESSPDPGSSIHERLKLSVGSLQTANTISTSQPVSFKKEFEIYDRTKVRSPMLEKLFNALSSVQPTSTQSERNFSLAASIVTYKRARLSSPKLDAQCFLKSYFLAKK
jgi:hypothetical protein